MPAKHNTMFSNIFCRLLMFGFRSDSESGCFYSIMNTTGGCKVYWAKGQYSVHLYIVLFYNIDYLYCYYLSIHIYLNFSQIRFDESRPSYQVVHAYHRYINIHSWGTWFTPCPLHLNNLSPQKGQSAIQTLHFNWFCRVPLSVKCTLALLNFWNAMNIYVEAVFLWALSVHVFVLSTNPCWRSSWIGIKKEMLHN